MCYCCFREKVRMIFGCCIVGSCLRNLWGCFSCLRNPSIAIHPSFVTPSNKVGVKTAVALSSLPACPYAGPLLTSTRVEETVFGVSEGLPR
jgi:hypothetical protein